ncbi:MAG: hypothetical protein HC817_07840, partial [Saprospiraceae bacterium]|nr:hypothetical protein [Saprospiraceae bacterium]
FKKGQKDTLWAVAGYYKGVQNIVLVPTESEKKEHQIVSLEPVRGFKFSVFQEQEKNEIYICGFRGNPTFGFDYYRFQNNKQNLKASFFTGEANDKVKNIKLSVKKVQIDASQSLWLATDKGLIWLNPATLQWASCDKYGGKAISQILDIVAWGTDKFIVSTVSDGILFFDKTKGVFYEQIIKENRQNTEGVLCSEKFDYIYLDRYENLWLGSWDDGCVSHINLNKPKFSKFIHQNQPLGVGHSHILEDKKGIIWFSASNLAHIFKRDLNGKTKQVFIADADVGKTQDLFLDANNNLWLLTRTGRIYKKNATSDQFNLFFQDNSAKNALNQLPNRDMLLATNKGLFTFKNTESKIARLQPFQKGQFSSDTSIISINVLDNNLMLFSRNANYTLYKNKASFWDSLKTIKKLGTQQISIKAQRFGSDVWLSKFFRFFQSKNCGRFYF